MTIKDIWTSVVAAMYIAVGFIVLMGLSMGGMMLLLEFDNWLRQ